MHTNPFFQVAAKIFKALGSERRLTILLLLSRKPMNVVDLAERLGITTQATSRHLHVLLRSGLIDGERTGKEVIFSLAPHWNLKKILSLVIIQLNG